MISAMTAVEFSGLSIAAIGVVAAVLALPRHVQRWALPSIVVVLMLLLVVPFKEIKNDRVWVVAGVLAAAALGLGGWRVNVWLANRPPSAIFFEVDSLADGSVVRDKDVPLTVTGSYNGQAKGVRVVLQDKALQYYLQHPEVELGAGGQWKAVNIRPGKDIEHILFVQLGRRAKKHFAAMATAGQWGSFGDQLPPNTRPLASVAIDRK